MKNDYDQLECPRCKSQNIEEVDWEKEEYSSGKTAFYMMKRCLDCNCEYEVVFSFSYFVVH